MYSFFLASSKHSLCLTDHDDQGDAAGEGESDVEVAEMRLRAFYVADEAAAAQAHEGGGAQELGDAHAHQPPHRCGVQVLEVGVPT